MYIYSIQQEINFIFKSFRLCLYQLHIYDNICIYIYIYTYIYNIYIYIYIYIYQ